MTRADRQTHRGLRRSTSRRKASSSLSSWRCNTCPPEAIRAFLIGGPLRSRWRFLPTSANGQLAFGTYLWDEASGTYLPGGLDGLTIQNGLVAQIVTFLSADLTDFGLPASLPM